MIATEAGVIAQPHDPQCLGDSALAGSQRCASHQNQNMIPHRGGEVWPEYRQRVGQNEWDQMGMGCRGRGGLIRFHRSLRIDVRPRRKSPPGGDMTAPCELLSPP
jgi:hypothetical protein